MRKVVAIAVFVFVLVVSTSASIQAHPGRTDSNGCHTCRTNCEKWGLEYGEYHCHNGGSSSSGGPSSSTTSNSQPVQPEVEPQVTAPVEPKIDYAKAGSTDGYKFKMENPDKALKEASYAYTDSAYKKAFEEAYEKAENELSANTINLATENGKKDAVEKETYQLDNLPSKIIVSEYKEQYKEAFDKAEQEVKSSLESTAKRDAYVSVYDEKEATAPDDHGLKKYKSIYTTTYEKYIESYGSQKKELLKSAEENGKKDGESGEEQNLEFLDSVKDTKFYTAAKEAYVKSYEENKKEGSFIGGMVVIVALIGICYFIVKKIRNRKKVDFAS